MFPFGQNDFFQPEFLAEKPHPMVSFSSIPFARPAMTCSFKSCRYLAEMCAGANLLGKVVKKKADLNSRIKRIERIWIISGEEREVQEQVQALLNDGKYKRIQMFQSHDPYAIFS